jgi:MoaA/NifB/PqqE/SkfB family radical SAM enzyme
MTNRCNLLCTTCPRTYEELEPPADMSWELFTSIVDQIPDLQRAVLHGVGEPMLVRNLPRMVRYLKGRESWRPSLVFRARQGGAGAVASTSSRTCDDQMHIKCISP